MSALVVPHQIVSFPSTGQETGRVLGCAIDLKALDVKEVSLPLRLFIQLSTKFSSAVYLLLLIYKLTHQKHDDCIWRSSGFEVYDSHESHFQAARHLTLPFPQCNAPGSCRPHPAAAPAVTSQLGAWPVMRPTGPEVAGFPASHLAV